MSNRTIEPRTELLAATGGVDGTVTLATNRGFYLNAVGWLSDSTRSRRIKIIGKVGTTQLVVRFIPEYLGDPQPYPLYESFLTANSASLNQDLQVVEFDDTDFRDLPDGLVEVVDGEVETTTTGGGGGAPTGIAGGVLTGTYPNPSGIAALAITDAMVATANKDGLAATPSMRTLGSDAQQAVSGTDSRLADARTPSGAASGDLSGTYPGPLDVTAIHETSGPTKLTAGAVLDGQVFQRMGTTLVGNQLVANWSTTLVRYFLLDPVGGNDANLGYIDAAAGTTLAPAGLAKQTIAGIMAILPAVGNGRTGVVLQMPGALTESINTLGTLGYKFFMWRGSTDLTNNAADRVTLGGKVSVAGPGGSSEFTATSGATTTTVPIATGAFGAEPAALAYRIRFLGNTTTVALRNVCRVITTHTTTLLTLGSALPATPASGDTFVIDQPGAIVAGVQWQGLAAVTQSVLQSSILSGIGCTATAAKSFCVNGNVYCSFLELTGVTNNVVSTFDGEFISVSVAYFDESGSLQQPGVGLRTLSPTLFQNIHSVSAQALGLMNSAAATGFVSIFKGSTLGQSYTARRISYTSCGGPQGSQGNPAFQIGSTNATTAGLRTVGGLTITSTSGSISRVDIITAGATAGITVQGTGLTLMLDTISGSAGNTDVGVDLTAARFCRVVLGSAVANTVTGTAGDIRLAGPVIAVHTDFTLTNLIDSFGNDVVGTAGHLVDSCVLFTNGDATAHALGEVVRVSATNTVVRAKGDTAAHTAGPLWAAVTVPAAGAAGYYTSLGAPQKWVLHSAAPTLAALSYLSGTAGSNTTTIPTAGAGPVQKRRCGLVSKVSGSLGLVTGSCENLSVDADGLL